MANDEFGKGGSGGKIVIVTTQLDNNGTISAQGGDGLVGGNAGEINIKAQHVSNSGTFNAAGGNSSLDQLIEAIKNSQHPNKDHILKDIEESRGNPRKLANTLNVLLGVFGNTASILSLIQSILPIL